jgi:hypothetical protein
LVASELRVKGADAGNCSLSLLYQDIGVITAVMSHTGTGKIQNLAKRGREKEALGA